MKKQVSIISILIFVCSSLCAQTWEVSLEKRTSEIVPHETDGTLYAICDSSIYISINEGASWGKIKTFNGLIRSMTVSTGHILYTGVHIWDNDAKHEMWRGAKINDIWTWDEINAGLPDANLDGKCDTRFSQMGNFNHPFVGLNDGPVYYYSENEHTWDTVKSVDFPIYTYVNDFIVHRDTAYIALDNLMQNGGGIWYSTDGLEWKKSGLNGDDIFAVTELSSHYSNANGQSLFIARTEGGNGVYTSFNGREWNPIDWPYDDYWIRYAIDNESVYTSYEDFSLNKLIIKEFLRQTATWTDITGTLPSNLKTAMTLILSDNYILIATSQGIYRRAKSTTNLANHLKSNEELDIRAFPNPCKENITISVDAENSNYIEISVYDSQGRILFEEKAEIDPTKNATKNFFIPLENNTGNLFYYTIKSDHKYYTNKFIRL